MKKLLLTAAFCASVWGFAAAAETVYKVGTLPTSKPFTFLDVGANKIDGAMIQIMNEAAKAAGFKVEFEAIEWKALIPSLTSGKIDMANALMIITPERAKVIDFADPILDYAEGLVVRATDTTAYKNIKDLSGKTIGVQTGTAFYKYLQDSGHVGEIKVYDSTPDIIRDLQLKRLDGALLDYPLFNFRIKQGQYPDLRMVQTYQPGAIGKVAFAVKKGNPELLDKINAGLRKLNETGRVAAIYKEWNLD
jgi:polar amino acid transport system substrate-binding protein